MNDRERLTEICLTQAVEYFEAMGRGDLVAIAKVQKDIDAIGPDGAFNVTMAMLLVVAGRAADAEGAGGTASSVVREAALEVQLMTLGG